MGVTKVVANDPYSANYNHKATIAVANTLVSECSELQIRPQFQVDRQYQADCQRDKLSGEITPYKEGELFEEEGPLEAQMIFLALDRYPYWAPTEKILGPQVSKEPQNGLLPK